MTERKNAQEPGVGVLGMPWSLRQPSRPQYFALPSARAANQAIVRVVRSQIAGSNKCGARRWQSRKLVSITEHRSGRLRRWTRNKTIRSTVWEGASPTD